MSALCIIPARGGSKRIPRKNIKPFAGKPIIAYSIETALNSGLFDEVMVSTDDAEIAQIAVQAGADVPFYRSEKAASDHATTADVVQEVLARYREQGKTFASVCIIYPTAPFLSSEVLIEAQQMLKTSGADSVFPVLPLAIPTERSLARNEAGKTYFKHPEHTLTRSQDLPEAFRDAGQFYWLNTARFGETGLVISPNSYSITLDPMHAHDIDDERDWEIAEFKFAWINRRE